MRRGILHPGIFAPRDEFASRAGLASKEPVCIRGWICTPPWVCTRGWVCNWGWVCTRRWIRSRGWVCTWGWVCIQGWVCIWGWICTRPGNGFAPSSAFAPRGAFAPRLEGSWWDAGGQESPRQHWNQASCAEPVPAASCRMPSMPSKPYWAGAVVTAPSGSAALGAQQSPVQLVPCRDRAGLGERCDTTKPMALQEIPAESTRRVPSAAGTCPVPAWGLDFVPVGGCPGVTAWCPHPLTHWRAALCVLPVPVGCVYWEHWFCPHFCCWLSQEGAHPHAQRVLGSIPLPSSLPCLLFLPLQPREGIVLMGTGVCPTTDACGAGAGGLGSCPRCPPVPPAPG